MNVIARIVGAIDDETQSGWNPKNDPKNYTETGVCSRMRSRVNAPSPIILPNHTNMLRRTEDTSSRT